MRVETDLGADFGSAVSKYEALQMLIQLLIDYWSGTWNIRGQIVSIELGATQNGPQIRVQGPPQLHLPGRYNYKFQ